jgi:glycosyltransferase involved in cell wall biosynthesis
LALVVPSLASGGGVPAVARFIKEVAVRSGQFDLRVVSLSESARDPLSLRLMAPGSWSNRPAVEAGEWDRIPFVHVGAIASELEFQQYRARRVLSQVIADCDVIQVVCGFPAWANTVVGLGKPLSMHVATRARVERRHRDAQPRTPSEWWRKAMTGITDKMDDNALRTVDAIQVMNPWMFDYAEGVNAGRDVDLQYLPPGVDTRRFRPLDSGRPQQSPYILCLARFNDPRKRIEVLLEAYARIPEPIRRVVRLVLAGSGPLPTAFWDRARGLGLADRVTFIERPDAAALLRLYREASVFALPSDEEGFGMVLLEAMACGVPVVSTRSGGPEGIITDGEDGYLVDREDVQALAGRLTLLLEAPEQAARMGSRARQTTEQRYDEFVVGGAFVGIWEDLANRAGVA